MKKLTTSVLAVVLTSSFALVNAQVDTTKTQDIEGVVVTALGIKREKKSLTYSSQEVKADELTKGTTNTGNIASQLSGKVAGLQVNTNNNFGGSSNLLIRGYKSLNGGTPLIVMDGSPVSNSTLSGFFDYGNFLADINQEDIESINILKGAAASALYGERGLNGVIVITTKNGRGKSDNKWGVTLNSSASFGVIDKSTFPEYQSKYGGGYGGQDFSFGNQYTNYNDDASLGPLYDGHQIYFWDAFDPSSPNYGKTKPYLAGAHTPVDFFETSSNYTNTISLEKANDKSNLMLSYTNQLMNGIMPNSELRKNTLSTKFNFDLTDKLTASVYSTLTLQDTKGRNETGYSDNLVTAFREWWNTDVDIYDQRDAYFRTGQNISWNRKSPTNGTPAYWNNPYFQRYENYQSDDRMRSFSYASINYEFSKNISATAKLSYDHLGMTLEQRIAEGSVAQAFGRSGNNVTSGYSKQVISQDEVNFDLFSNYKFDLTDNIDLSGIVGANVRRNQYSSDFNSTEGGLVVPGLYSLTNSKGATLPTLERLDRIATASAYATASLGFLDTYFIDGTYRVDKSSTLPRDNRTYGYGSVAGSIVLSNLIKQDWLSFWKIRGNYAVVGGSTGAYQLKNTYTAIDNLNGLVLYNPTPIDGTFTYTLANSELKPERSKEVELGMEMQFFKRRLGFDVTIYQSKTENQIIKLPISAGNGWNNSVYNAGRIDNKGIEVSFNVTPIKSVDFRWDILANWAKNENKVVDLNGVDNYQLGAYQGGVTLNATVGEAMGTLRGQDYVYNEDGQRIVRANGLWQKSAVKVIGNITPDWTGGVRNTFNYKGLSLSFLIDVQQGGDTFSTDTWYGYAGGLYADTAGNDYRDPSGVILPGVQADGSPNTVVIGNGALDSSNYYGYQPKGYGNAPTSEHVYDTSYVKLREASISYSLPKNILSGTFLQDVTLSLVGRNLWIIHKNLPYADPEAGVGGGLRGRGNSIGILPTTRDFGFNINVKF